MSSKLILLHFIVSVYFTSSSAELSSEKQALLTLRTSLGGRLRLWNISEPTPCNWVGVICSKNASFVTELHLSRMGLSGVIPQNSISILTHLTTLSLPYNAIVSPLPKDFSKLKQLRKLYLQHNLFTGNIPDWIFSLHSLIRVDLTENKFSGPIPKEFGDSKRLARLILESKNIIKSDPNWVFFIVVFVLVILAFMVCIKYICIHSA